MKDMHSEAPSEDLASDHDRWDIGFMMPRMQRPGRLLYTKN